MNHPQEVETSFDQTAGQQAFQKDQTWLQIKRYNQAMVAKEL
jgi:hypothetical protein